jgi:1,4-alpha-glucan branching enzyme
MINLMITLHCHIPYVRKRGIWPYGEEWIYESMLESYIPLIMMLRDLSISGQKNILSVSISPILIEQLNDDYIKEGFNEYLHKRIELTNRDISDFTKKSWNNLKVIAEYQKEYLSGIKNTWEMLQGNLLETLSNLEKSGLIEIGASSATHAILPLLSKKSIDRQIDVGMKSLKQRMNITPKFFWLPECAYKLGLEESLESAGISFVFMGSNVSGNENPYSPYQLGNTKVVAVSRQWELSKKIWSTESGFPGDPRYREFQKRYRRSGNRYWHITGSRVSLAKKGILDIEKSRVATNEHVHEFMETLNNLASDGENKTVLLSFDAEVFGQTWFEGIEWLKKVILSIKDSKEITLTTPGNILAEIDSSELESLRPHTCCWGKDGNLESWSRPSVSWMWEELGTMASKFFDLEKDKNINKMHLAQLERELLLSQASDWPFLITSKNARVYGEKRFRMHAKAFWNIVDMIETDFKGFNFELIVKKDNPFPFLG